MYLVDSSVWIDFLRGETTRQVAALERLLAGDDIVGVAPIILQEVLQGADSQARLDKWRRYFAHLKCYLPRDPVATHLDAARLFVNCRRAGKTPRSSNDCLIARIAIEHALVLVHDDRDFEAIALVESKLRLFRA